MDADNGISPATTDVASPVLAEDAPGKPTPNSFQDLVDWLPHPPDWSDARRRSAVSQLRSLAWILFSTAAERGGRLTLVARSEVVLSGVPCSVGWVNDHLPNSLLRSFRIARGTFSTMLGTYRMIMIAHGMAEQNRCDDLPPDSDWGRFLRGCPTYDRLAVKRLAAWCHCNGIAPAELDNAAFGRFQTESHERLVAGHFFKIVQRTAYTWNRLVEQGLAVAGAATLTVPSRRRPYVLHPAEFGPECAEELEAIAALMRGNGRTTPRRRSEPPRLRERSTDTYIFSLRQALTAVAQLRPNGPPPRMGDLGEGEMFEDILMFYFRRARGVAAGKAGVDPDSLPEDVGVTAQTEGIAKAMLWAAQFFLKLPPPVMVDLRDRASAFRPRRGEDIHPKVRARLDQLAEPAARARLLHLPLRLMRHAAALKSRSEGKQALLAEAARLAMVAAAIEIEFYYPLRIEDLSELHLVDSLIRTKPRDKLVAKLRVPAPQTKGKRLIDWPLDADPARLVQRYIDEFRPTLTSADNLWLFPAGGGSDHRRSVSSLGSNIVSEVEQHVGVRVNPHLFRAFLACWRLERDPGAINDIRLLLGHKGFEALLRYYAYVQPKITAVRHAQAIARERHALHPLVKSWVRGGKEGRHAFD
jgi:integrase